MEKYATVIDGETGEFILLPTHSKEEILDIVVERFVPELLEQNVVINLGVPKNFIFHKNILEDDEEYFITSSCRDGKTIIEINLVLE